MQHLLQVVQHAGFIVASDGEGHRQIALADALQHAHGIRWLAAHLPDDAVCHQPAQQQGQHKASAYHDHDQALGGGVLLHGLTLKQAGIAVVVFQQFVQDALRHQGQRTDVGHHELLRQFPLAIQGGGRDFIGGFPV